MTYFHLNRKSGASPFPVDPIEGWPLALAKRLLRQLQFIRPKNIARREYTFNGEVAYNAASGVMLCRLPGRKSASAEKGFYRDAALGHYPLHRQGKETVRLYTRRFFADRIACPRPKEPASSSRVWLG